MKINKPRQDQQDLSSVIDALGELLRMSVDVPFRPCTGCQRPCNCSGSPSCACSCTVQCASAAASISSEPESYPVEARVLPLVMELNKSGFIQTCWSCEGHTDASGRISKIPRIWFYTQSHVYVRILANVLSRAKLSHKLSYDWIIKLVNLEDGVGNSYSLEPDLTYVDKPDLFRLQEDLFRLSDQLNNELYQEARSLLARTQSSCSHVA